MFPGVPSSWMRGCGSVVTLGGSDLHPLKIISKTMKSAFLKLGVLTQKGPLLTEEKPGTWKPARLEFLENTRGNGNQEAAPAPSAPRPRAALVPRSISTLQQPPAAPFPGQLERGPRVSAPPQSEPGFRKAQGAAEVRLWLVHFNKARTLQEIREDCVENLRQTGEASPRVFLLSSWELTKYDFQLLQETLENELDEQKRHIFILALPNISAKILEKKKAELQEHIWEVALISCAIGALPVPGLSLICDVAILVVHMERYCLAFGLDEESLTRLAQQVDKPVAELKSAIKKSPLASAITKGFVLSLLSRSLCGALMVVELILNFVPVIGSLAGGGISFVTTRYLLRSFLDDAAEDAQNILTKALERRAEESI
ncbi:interferon-inducible GTPase 5-like [Mauremys mutica]|uniref:interferon-inducible GTPase 5-like n=1 Tax=Mauremys mutica TaxID=74926 RepID=UPI001D167526|nr:interferon-inducible GTPase 5-like [Mauremys mutica]